MRGGQTLKGYISLYRYLYAVGKKYLLLVLVVGAVMRGV